MVVFPEGTRYNPQLQNAIEKSRSYAQLKGLLTFFCHLTNCEVLPFIIGQNSVRWCSTVRWCKSCQAVPRHVGRQAIWITPSSSRVTSLVVSSQPSGKTTHSIICVWEKTTIWASPKTKKVHINCSSYSRTATVFRDPVLRQLYYWLICKRWCHEFMTTT